MCDSCGNTSSPSRDFTPLHGISVIYSHTLSRYVSSLIYGETLHLCLPCYRAALKVYKSARIPAPAPRPPAAGVQQCEKVAA